MVEQKNTSQLIEQFRFNLRKRLDTLWELEEILADKEEDDDVITFKHITKDEIQRILNICKLIEKGKI